jgi:Xaa-Pro aminopeptidase
MEKKYIDAYMISSLDDIAWLFNLRGNDVSNNPVFLSYTIITKDTVNLYVNEEKLTVEAKEQLESSQVIIKEYSQIFKDVAMLKDKKILCSKKKTSEYMANQINESNEVVYGIDLTTHLKAQKNEVEIDNLKNVFIKDGIAMVKFLHWLDKNIGQMTIDEVAADEKLQNFRKEQDLYKQDSFPYISGYGSNGAIIHYRAKKESCSKLEAKSLYLIDSGGQYLDGTTDITRTVVLGDLIKEEKTDFTLTLMGHIELAKAQFLEGTYGSNLDILARKPLWDHGLDYKHGTGHGVGFFLNVHEGPQNIALPLKAVTLKEGMLISNEPGMYRDGKHGIRLENLVLVQKSRKTDFGQFYRFETMTLCPIDFR